MARPDLGDVVRRFGLRPARIRRIPRGFVNRVWLVDADQGRYVLKRATPERPTEDLVHEHLLLAHLAAGGWRVPAPIADGSGSSLVEVHGARWWLAPWIPGRAPRHASPSYGRWAGALLAELHRAAADFRPPPLERPPLWLRSVADWPFFPTGLTLRDGIERLRLVDAALAQRAAEAVVHLEERLPPAAGRRFGATTTHFDFHHDNLRVHRGSVAVLDFDFAHEDERAADVATALHFTPDPTVASAFVDGYDAVARLATGEVAALPAFFDARTLMHVAWLLTQPDVGAIVPDVRSTLDELGSCPVR